jgi:hypothetical protein
MIAALGKNGQILNVVPSLGLVLVRMGDPPDTSLYISTYFNNQIWQLLNNIICNQTAIKTGTTTPVDFTLAQNFPNPFNPETIINYQLTINNSVSLKIYDMLGREIATLVNEEKPAGSYEVNFNGSKLSSGVYLLRMTAGEFSSTIKMSLVK